MIRYKPRDTIYETWLVMRNKWSGFIGEGCELRANDACRKLNCSKFGGRCIRLEPMKRNRHLRLTFAPKDAVCACPDGFVGDTCEERSNSCTKMVSAELFINPNNMLN